MTALFTFDRLAHLVGLILGLTALAILGDRTNPKRLTTALFWGLLAYCLMFDGLTADLLGKQIAHRVIGAVVLALALIAGLGGMGRGAAKAVDEGPGPSPIGAWIFAPSLLIPVVVIIGVLLPNGGALGAIRLFDSQASLEAFGVAAVLALVLACVMTRSTPVEAFAESRRLLDVIGWTAVLPMMLAILGGVFAVAKTGDAIKVLIMMIAPEHQRLLVVAIYCVGMALFTAIMGNAFAAFPVMTAGLGLPILVHQMGGAPAPIVAIGMYAGYCGTLLTPMAANFNIMPAALLELKDRYGVIKAQAPTAIAMLIVNILLMYALAFR